MSEEYLLMIIREQGRQIGELTTAIQLHGQAVLSLCETIDRLKRRLMLVEARHAIEEMHDNEARIAH